MTLEERIKLMLAEACAAEKKEDEKEKETPEMEKAEIEADLKGKRKITSEELEVMSEEDFLSLDLEMLDEESKAVVAKRKKVEIEVPATAAITPEVKKMTESETPSQVTALLEAEGLSEEFKLQAVTIFEAAVADRAMQIEESLQKKFDAELVEAKLVLENDIDGFLNETAQKWAADNSVAIKHNFKTRLAESFMDGLQALLAEHNVDLPEVSENALDIALEQVNALEESVSERSKEISALQEQIDKMKADKIMESFRGRMAGTEFDRFEQLSAGIAFANEEQYSKQLNIVMENFGKVAPVVESKQEVEKVEVAEIVTEDHSNMAAYTNFMANQTKLY